jgi:hypothetical protein
MHSKLTTHHSERTLTVCAAAAYRIFASHTNTSHRYHFCTVLSLCVHVQFDSGVSLGCAAVPVCLLHGSANQGKYKLSIRQLVSLQFFMAFLLVVIGWCYYYIVSRIAGEFDLYP